MNKEIDYKKQHQTDFKNWIKRENIPLYNKLPDVLPNCTNDLEIGQECTFINDYGLKMPGYMILGFCERQNNMFTGEDTGRYVFLDKSSYWFPVKSENIIIQSKINKTKR